MLKKHEVNSVGSCLNKSQDDEPIFVLCARDPIAPIVVKMWALLADGVHSVAKINDAKACAQQMQEWKQKEVWVYRNPAMGFSEQEDAFGGKLTNDEVPQKLQSVDEKVQRRDIVARAALTMLGGPGCNTLEVLHDLIGAVMQHTSDVQKFKHLQVTRDYLREVLRQHS